MRIRLKTAKELLAEVEGYKAADHPADRFHERLHAPPSLLQRARSAAKGVPSEAGPRAHAPLYVGNDLVGYAAYKHVGKNKKPVLTTILGPDMKPNRSTEVGAVVVKEAATRAAKILSRAQEIRGAARSPADALVLQQAKALKTHPRTVDWALAQEAAPKSLLDYHIDSLPYRVSGSPVIADAEARSSTNPGRLMQLLNTRDKHVATTAAMNPNVDMDHARLIHAISPQLAEKNPATALHRLVEPGYPNMSASAAAKDVQREHRMALHSTHSGRLQYERGRMKTAADKIHKKITFQGLPVHIDRPKGFVQSGKDAQGKPWQRTYKYDYGFIPKTQGGDNEDLDVFIGPKAKSDAAFWVSQRKDDGSFDEYKVFLGFSSQAAAKKAYLEHVPRKYYGGMEEMPVAAMKTLLNQQPFDKTASFRNMVHLLSKRADDLTDAARAKLKTKTFAIPQDRKYPIPDASHARAALSMVAAHGTPAEKTQVAGAVQKKFPALASRSTVVAENKPEEITTPKQAADYALSLLKLSAPRWAKEVGRAMQHEGIDAARGISSQMSHAAPRLINPLSMGGQEAAVGLMAGKPIQGNAAGGLFARKMYKPDSAISNAKGTTKLLAQKQQATDTIWSISPEARSMVPEMHGFKEMGSGDKLRHISDHEYVHGARGMQPHEYAGATRAVQDKVVFPLDMQGMPVGDLPTFTGHGHVTGNVSNVMMDAAGKPKVMDFLPTGGGSPVRMDNTRTSVLSLAENATSKFDGSKGGRFNDLAKEVHRPGTSFGEVPVFPQNGSWGKAIDLPGQQPAIGADTHRIMLRAGAPSSGVRPVGGATPVVGAATPVVNSATPVYQSTPRMVG